LPATAPAAGSADADPSEGRAGTGDASSLAQYRQAYEDADQALSEGRFAQARAGFRSVLDRWPNRYLAVEAQMKLLQCDFGLGDAAATLAQAEAIQDLPAFAARRSEILRLRAESLVRLDRCEEAVSVAEQIGARDAAEIRRGCRAGRKEP
jgi:TolA-binding protein